MLYICEMYMMQMLDKVVASVEGSMHFWFVTTLLVLVRSHVNFVRTLMTTEEAHQLWVLLSAAAYPGSPKGMNRIFMSDPLVLCLEGSRAERAEERKVPRWLTSVIHTIDPSFIIG